MPSTCRSTCQHDPIEMHEDSKCRSLDHYRISRTLGTTARAHRIQQRGRRIAGIPRRVRGIAGIPRRVRGDVGPKSREKWSKMMNKLPCLVNVAADMSVGGGAGSPCCSGRVHTAQLQHGHGTVIRGRKKEEKRRQVLLFSHAPRPSPSRRPAILACVEMCRRVYAMYVKRGRRTNP